MSTLAERAALRVSDPGRVRAIAAGGGPRYEGDHEAVYCSRCSCNRSGDALEPNARTEACDDESCPCHEEEPVEYLMEPRSDGRAVTIEILAARVFGEGVADVEPQLVLDADDMAIAACVPPSMARALVRALLPLCPEPLVGRWAGGHGSSYPPVVRDQALVEAALRVLGPVFAVDEAAGEADPGEEPF